MKKENLIVLAACLLVLAGCKKKSPPTGQPETLPQPTFADNLTVGEPVTFEVQYRGITGKKDDLRPYSFNGFGEAREYESEIIDAVKKVVKDEFVVIQQPRLRCGGMEYSLVEYKDRKVLAAYMDLNGDGALSDNERLEPSIGWNSNPNRDEFDFITPDFVWSNNEGLKMPFRVLLRATFYGKNIKPQAMWSSLGLYEGIVKFNGVKRRFYLFPDYDAQGYTIFGRSQYSLVSASREKKDWVPRQDLSSLIVHDKTFYRVAVAECAEDTNKLVISLAEDKSPRGKVDMKIHGTAEFKHRLNNATLHGVDDKTIHFSISGTNELPAGKYYASSGYIIYDKADAGDEAGYDYNTSFRDVPAFEIAAGQTTTVDIGKPEVKIQAVELKKRYHSDKKYKTEFAAGTNIYMDAIFQGQAGETYRGFEKEVQKENYRTNETIKARIKMVDADGNEIVNEELEYG